MRYVVPVVRMFPIWRYGEYIPRLSVRAIPVVGWHPDRYAYREFASAHQAQAFIDSFRTRHA